MEVPQSIKQNKENETKRNKKNVQKTITIINKNLTVYGNK